MLAGVSTPLSAQELQLKRDYPGSGPYICAEPIPVAEPTPDQRSRAGQLASDANQALILGDLEQVETLLDQAVELDPASADLAYRHGQVLEELTRSEQAMREYCRVIDLGGAAIGIGDARERIDVLYEQIRARLPRAAREAFLEGIVEADDSLYQDAVESFTVANELAPDWPDPIYNRAVIYERMGQVQLALIDFRRYLQVVADPEDADAIAISARIGQLEGAASVPAPSPAGALALGVVPGMGYYYTRRPVPGTLTLVVAGASVAAGFLYRDVTVYCLNDVPAGADCPGNEIVGEVTDRPYLWYGVGVGALVTVIGAIDAYRKAKQARSDAAALTAPSETGLNVGLPTVSTDGRRLDLSFVRYRFR